MLEAANAEAAVAVWGKRLDIGLIFTDVQMPGNCDGLGLAREAHLRWPHIRVLITSGRLKSDDMPTDTRFIAKPYAVKIKFPSDKSCLK